MRGTDSFSFFVGFYLFVLLEKSSLSFLKRGGFSFSLFRNNPLAFAGTSRPIQMGEINIGVPVPKSSGK